MCTDAVAWSGCGGVHSDVMPRRSMIGSLRTELWEVIKSGSLLRLQVLVGELLQLFLQLCGFMSAEETHT